MDGGTYQPKYILVDIIFDLVGVLGAQDADPRRVDQLRDREVRTLTVIVRLLRELNEGRRGVVLIGNDGGHWFDPSTKRHNTKWFR